MTSDKCPSSHDNCPTHHIGNPGDNPLEEDGDVVTCNDCGARWVPIEEVRRLVSALVEARDYELRDSRPYHALLAYLGLKSPGGDSSA